MTERRYLIVIEGADGANHSAYAPDLPGVVATGATPEECEHEIQAAIAFHLEGLRDAGESAPEPYPARMAQPQEIEFVFEPQQEGGYHVYAPDLPGLHTQGDSLEDATDNAREALHLYVEGLREEGRPIDTGVVRRKLPMPA
jgi:predicted RNase H-like HicB family nuclease